MTQEKLILRALSFIVKLLWNIFLDLRKGQSPEPLFREGTLLAADLETYFKEHTLVVVQSEGKPS